jgi:hypothetical protein
MTLTEMYNSINQTRYEEDLEKNAAAEIADEWFTAGKIMAQGYIDELQKHAGIGTSIKGAAKYVGALPGRGWGTYKGAVKGQFAKGKEAWAASKGSKLTRWQKAKKKLAAAGRYGASAGIAATPAAAAYGGYKFATRKKKD